MDFAAMTFLPHYFVCHVLTFSCTETAPNHLKILSKCVRHRSIQKNIEKEKERIIKYLEINLTKHSSRLTSYFVLNVTKTRNKSSSLVKINKKYQHF